MADNIDMMIKNQEKAEILQDKTGKKKKNDNNDTCVFVAINNFLYLFF